MTRENGEIVRLAWKQVATLLFAAIMPALTFGGALWYWAERVVIVEAVQGYHTTYIERLDNRVTQMEARDGSLNRIEQHLIDIDRQLAEIKQRSK